MKIMKTLYHFRKIISYCRTSMEKHYFHRTLGKKFKRHSPKLKETKTVYSFAGNKYSKKRHAMHINIVNEFMKQASSPKNGEKPIVVLIGGGTASGKTTIRQTVIKKKLIERSICTVTVDPDEIKDYIPEYELLKKKHPNDAARLVHKESLDISELLVKRLIRHRKHFMHEGTMARTQKYKKLIKKFKKAGYEIHAYIVDIPLELAKQRVAERAKISGREIPPHIIENTHKLVPHTVEVIKNRVDRYYVYDNRNGLVLIASNDYIEPGLYDEFLKKGE
ncbi:zeta toxin family protein [Niallia endozanthoxylica]|nr:zeta toxin family protein [Niallia endozanthoxylica]